MSQDIAPWMQTLTGRVFDFENLAVNVFDKHEVASGLAREGRYGNQCKWPYTVAQHSVLVARNVWWSERRLVALLHDVAEVWLGDMIGPLKAYLRSKDNHAYHALERQIQRWAAHEHSLDSTWFYEGDVDFQDKRALATEYRDLMLPPPKPLIDLPNPWKERIEPWHSDYARDEWLGMYEDCFVS